MKILFMGTDVFAVPSLIKLAEVHEVTAVVTRPDKPRGRGQKVTPTPVKQAAEELGIPVYEPKNLSSAKFKEILDSLDFDLIVTAAYGRLLPKDFIEKYTNKCICLHPSLLPKYRGCSPIESAILDGSNKTGISVFNVGTEFDTGDIIYIEEKEIYPEDTGGSLRERFSKESPDILIKAIQCIESGACPIPQVDSEAVYAPKICREDAEIIWTDPAEKIRNQIRAFNPKPGAFTNFRGKILKVLMAEKTELLSDSDPGSITDVNPHKGFTVACGEGALILLQVQPEGKKVMDASAFVLGYHPNISEKLG